MKTKRAKLEFTTTLLWILLASIFTFYVLGAAVSVPWGNAWIPVSDVVASIEWRKVLRPRGDESLAVMACAGCLVILYTLLSSWRWRLGFMFVGLVAPLILMGPTIIIMTIGGPVLAVRAFCGFVDGEFYVENMPEATAVGLWMLVCLGYATIQLCRARRQLRENKPQHGGKGISRYAFRT
jgi:hypothetical protein